MLKQSINRFLENFSKIFLIYIFRLDAIQFLDKKFYKFFFISCLFNKAIFFIHFNYSISFQKLSIILLYKKSNIDNYNYIIYNFYLLNFMIRKFLLNFNIIYSN